MAREAAQQLTERDALRAHARVELGIDPDELTNPWHAAWASFLAFTAGALLPLLAMVLPRAAGAWRSPCVSVLAALVVTGWISARLGAAGPGRRWCGMWRAVRWPWRLLMGRGLCWGRSGCDGHGPEPYGPLAEIAKKQAHTPGNTCG